MLMLFQLIHIDKNHTTKSQGLGNTLNIILAIYMVQPIIMILNTAEVPTLPQNVFSASIF